MDKKYYDTLNIPTTSSLDDIKKAYKKLAMEWHPDKNQDVGAIDKFREISDAYQYLLKKNNTNVHEFKDPYDLFDEMFVMFSNVVCEPIFHNDVIEIRMSDNLLFGPHGINSLFRDLEEAAHTLRPVINLMQHPPPKTYHKMRHQPSRQMPKFIAPSKPKYTPHPKYNTHHNHVVTKSYPQLKCAPDFNILPDADIDKIITNSFK